VVQPRHARLRARRPGVGRGIVDLRFGRCSQRIFGNAAAASRDDGAIRQDHGIHVNAIAQHRRRCHVFWRRGVGIDHMHGIDAGAAAAHQHDLLILSGRQQHSCALIARGEIEGSRNRGRGQRRERARRRVQEARLHARAAQAHAGVEHATVFQQMQVRVERPIDGGARHGPTRGIGVELILQCANARGDESPAVAERHQRRIPAVVLHRLHERPLFGDRIEQQRARQSEEGVIALGAAANQHATVRKNGLPGAKHVGRRRRHREAAVLVVVDSAAESGRVQLIVARAGEEQDLARVHERGMHSQNRRFAGQQLPITLGCRLHRIDRGLRRHLEQLLRRFFFVVAPAVHVLAHSDDVFGDEVDDRSCCVIVRYRRNRI
jgi:hypothetical protein